MTRTTRIRAARPASAMRVMAWTGAGMFAGSLLYFLYFYAVTLGRSGAPETGPASTAVFANVALFSLFAVHHSLLARSRFKLYVRRLLPPELERSAYVWIASLLLVMVCVFWRPLPGVAWTVEGAWRWMLGAMQLIGVYLSVSSAARIDIWELAGVRQARGNGAPASSAADSPLTIAGPYRWLRHPIYLGWILLVFGAPTMTMGRLLFASISSAYLVVAIPFEERSLEQEFGERYRAYRLRVPTRLFPGVW